ncbi:MAG: IS1595 family transposase [Verrucomicrobiae bacterium]|nr:IS1595 family transposase [Verrucomicrobiae bacterium]
MKHKTIQTPDDLTLDEITQRFSTDAAARKYWEAIHWPKGPVCPHCSNKKPKLIYEIKANKAKRIRPGLRQCAKCGKQFTATMGTIFEQTHIPLRKWLVAWYLVCSSKKGISSLQIQRILDLGSYRTALFMTHRIRHALRDPVFNDKLRGTVECDETYVGGKTRGRGRHFMGNKTPVVALLERGGRVRSQVMPLVTGKNLKEALEQHISPKSTIMTDELPAYRKAAGRFAKHYVVNHSRREYVRGRAHTNGVEGNFSLLKRGVVGTFHHLSAKRLPLYLAEFDHRHNTRFLTDGERTIIGMKKSEGKRLFYRNPAK